MIPSIWPPCMHAPPSCSFEFSGLFAPGREILRTIGQRKPVLNVVLHLNDKVPLFFLFLDFLGLPALGPKFRKSSKVGYWSNLTFYIQIGEAFYMYITSNTLTLDGNATFTCGSEQANKGIR